MHVSGLLVMPRKHVKTSDIWLIKMAAKMPIQMEAEMAPELPGLVGELRSWARHADRQPNPAPMRTPRSHACLLMPIFLGS